MGDNVLLCCVEKNAFTANVLPAEKNGKKVPGGGRMGWTPYLCNTLGMLYFDCDIILSDGINPSIKEKDNSKAWMMSSFLVGCVL